MREVQPGLARQQHLAAKRGHRVEHMNPVTVGGQNLRCSKASRPTADNRNTDRLRGR